MASVNAASDANKLARELMKDDPKFSVIANILAAGKVTPDTPLEALGGKSAVVYVIEKGFFDLFRLLPPGTPEGVKLYMDKGKSFFLIESWLKNGTITFPDDYSQSELDSLLLKVAQDRISRYLASLLLEKGAKPTPAIYETGGFTDLFILHGVPYKKEQVPDLIRKVIDSSTKFDDSEKTALETLLKDYDMKSEGGNLLIFVGETLYDTTRFEVVQFLIEHGADPTQKDKEYGLTCYQYLILVNAFAISPSRFGYFSSLLGKSKDQMISETVERVRELLFDLMKDLQKTRDMPKLMNPSLDFLKRNGGFDYFVKGLTPLMYLSILHIDAELLLPYGPNLTLKTPEGMTAAHFAWLDGYIKNTNLSKLCGHMRIPEKRIDDEMKELKWKGAGAVGRNGGNRPIFSWIGHGNEEIRQITGGTVSGRPTRNKILPGRILLVAAECGMYSYFDDEVKKAIRVSNAIGMKRVQELFENLYSTDMTKVVESFKRLQTLFDTKLHMYREGDEYPEINVDFDKSFKSGLYKFPIDVTEFLTGDTMRKYNGSASSLAGAIYPTPTALEQVSNIFTKVIEAKKESPTPTLVDEFLRKFIFSTSMGKLMEVFGEGIYIFPGCRAISTVIPNHEKMVKATGTKKNILESLRLYKNFPTANATTISTVSALEEPIRRTRANSLERQRKYTEVPATGGGSAAASRLPAIETRRLNSRVHTPNDVNESWTPIEKGSGRHTNRGGTTTRGRDGATRGRGGAAPPGGRPTNRGGNTGGRPTNNNGWTTVRHTPRGGNTTRGRGGSTRGRGRGGAAPPGGRPPTGGKKTRKLNRQK